MRVCSKEVFFFFNYDAGADPGFLLGGGALVSCSTSTPINHIVYIFLQNPSCIRKPQVISGKGGGNGKAPYSNGSIGEYASH